MNMKKVEMLASMLRAQIQRDTVWCAPCGMANADGQERPVPEAVSNILVSSGEMRAKVPCCRECVNRRMRDPLANDAGCEPIEQAAYLSIATQLINELRLPSPELKAYADALWAQRSAQRFTPTSALEAQANELDRFTKGGKSQGPGGSK